MNLSDLASLLPLIVLAAVPIGILLVIAFHRSHRTAAAMALAGLAIAFLALMAPAANGSRPVTGLLILDPFGLLYTGFIIAASFVVACLSYGYLKKRARKPEEFYVLLLLAALGACVLATSSHFASFFLGLEILSISLYILIAYTHTNPISIEGGVKYLILAAVSTAFLLFGMALIYAEAGTMDFSRLASLLEPPVMADHPLLLPGVGLLLTGIGFKLALVPFHLWTPDVYQGAPAPVTAFLATVSKGSVFALMLRFFHPVDLNAVPSLFWIFALLAITSMLAGNLLALLQSNVKRILAYSSIAHLGYLLVAFLAGGDLAVTAVTFYFAAYFVTTLGAFGVISLMSAPEREAEQIEDYRGLFWRRPWIAGVFTVMLLSLAGIPLTAGFTGKFYLAAAGVGSGLGWLVIILAVTSVIGLFYYLRIVIAMFVPGPGEIGLPAARSPQSLTGSLVLAALVALLVFLGVYPAPLIDLIQSIASSLT